ncbi:MAG TPA: hypothetical protein VFQ51_07945 [Vicinamibacteria bacterium]|nr:hypothetical protein [Vicinamibacteria bacterium]
MKTTSLLLTLVLAAPAAGPAQVAGHSTVPTSGPAARERSERPEEDPLLVQVDRLRRDLAELGKSYRKAKGPERESIARRAQPVLDQIAFALRDLSAGERPQDK